ncbi:MAG TPA: hypothetical protein VGH87_07025 [Polyangiaceae bacterium]
MEDHAPHDSLIPTIAEEGASAQVPAGVFHAAIAGGVGGLVAGLLGGVPYFLAYRDEDVPWQKLASAFFTFVILTGATYAAGARGGIATLDRLVRRKRAWTPFVGGVLGATIVGPLPGAVGVAYFGSQPYAFMGTAVLALAPIAGAWITSAEIARADRGGGLGASLGASLLATLIFGAVGAGIFLTVDDEAMLDWFRRGARAADASNEVSKMGLAFVGFQAGALLGALVGAHLGTTMFLSRITRSASHRSSG